MTVTVKLGLLKYKYLLPREDPRFPTVRGVMRRGMTVEGLKEFVIAQVNNFTFSCYLMVLLGLTNYGALCKLPDR
jgi:hypothetical protein